MDKLRHESWLAFFTISLIIASAGCGGSQRYPVDGKVQFADNRPATELVGASIEFDPVEGKEGARGEVQADGSFHMSTLKPGDGVAPGEYRVSIVPLPADLDRPSQRVLPRRYEDVNTSGLQVTVKAETNRITLTVEKEIADRK